jgi:hypothetical protein
VGDGDRYYCENWLNCCGVGDVDRYCCENWLNCCGVGDVDRYCCENWLNCCEVGDGDRYCCENWLNCCELMEVGGDDDNDDRYKPKKHVTTQLQFHTTQRLNHLF